MAINKATELATALLALAGDSYGPNFELSFTSRSSGDIILCRPHAMALTREDIADLWRSWDVDFAEIIPRTPDDCDECRRERVPEAVNPRTQYFQALNNFEMFALNRRN